MNMKKCYSYFDYKKVLAILTQLNKDVSMKSEGYCGIPAVNFEELEYQCFDALGNLISEEYFEVGFFIWRRI